VQTVPPTNPVVEGYADVEVAGMLLVGDLMSLTLSKYRQHIWETCNTGGWEETWIVWATEGVPHYLNGKISENIHNIISGKGPGWTDDEVTAELKLFMGVWNCTL